MAFIKAPYPRLQRGKMVSRGLVGAWPMGERGGTVLRDASGYGNHGVLVNGPTSVASQFGQVSSFSQSLTQCATVAASSSLLSSMTTGAHSIACWVLTPPSFSVWATIVGQDIWNSGLGWVMIMAGANYIDCYAAGTASGPRVIVPQGVWFHAVFTNSGGATKVYLNGALASSGTLPIVYGSTPLNIAARHSNGGGGYTDTFAGQLSDVRLYNRALSSSEVALIAAGLG